MKKIRIDFYHRKSFANRQDGERFLHWLLSGRTFSPEKWAPFEPIKRPFDPAHVGEAAESFANFSGMQKAKPPEKWAGLLVLKRTKTPKSLFYLEWNHYQHRPFNMCYFDIAENWLENANNLDAFLNFSDDLYTAFDGFSFASIASDEERGEKIDLKWFRPDKDHPNGGYVIEEAPGIFLEKGIPGIFWGNYFGPFYVEWFGRDKFKTLPCSYKKEMPDGGIFFATAESPSKWNTEEARAMELRIKNHLGADAFFHLQTLKESLMREIATGGEVTNDLPQKLTQVCSVPVFPRKS